MVNPRTSGAEPGALRRRIEALIGLIRHPNASAADVLEAEAILGTMRRAHSEANRIIFDGICLAAPAIADATGNDIFVGSAYDPIVELCRNANVGEPRISLYKSVMGASDTARVHGLWLEYMLFRSLALAVVDPTGITTAALRQEMYRAPQSEILSEMAEPDGNSIIDSMMVLSRAALDLTEAVTEANRKRSDRQKEN